MTFTGIDIGNTAIKVVCIDDDGSILGRSCPVSVEEAVRESETLGGGVRAYCTTRTLTDEEKRVANEAGWWEFHSGRAVPLKMAYRTPETLGADRLAAALGSWRLFPGENIMIADIGTAITLDIVGARGEFEGGNISPGIQMRLDALHEFTSRLPQKTALKMSFPFGRDTSSALICGATWGAAAEISGLYSMAKKYYGVGKLVMTGGGTWLVENELREISPKINLEIIPDLVAFGLKEAYRYSHD